MSTHNICFRGKIRKILCGYPLLSIAMGYRLTVTKPWAISADEKLIFFFFF